MAGLEGNPFADPFQQTSNSTPTNNVQPQQPSGYGGTAQSVPVRPAQATVPINEEELFRQQEELRRREQELLRRQQDLDNRARQQQRAGNGQRPPHNWPPLPKIIPLEPCFYQDIDVEIPAQFQVHSFYRGNGSGFSINKARQEFSNGVMSDRNVQNAANQAARAAAAHTVNEMVNSGGRY
uniref:Secretory carrier-associated membrane protein n=1 Tax=Meloidogyne hapla TaxID=6305 RepID=A0A1I8B2Z0_MELHA